MSEDDNRSVNAVITVKGDDVILLFDPVSPVYGPGRTVVGCNGTDRMFKAHTGWVFCRYCDFSGRCRVKRTPYPLPGSKAEDDKP